VALDANGVDLDLNAATAAVSRETPGTGVEETGAGAHYGLDQGRIIEQKGSDGSVKRTDRRPDTLLTQRSSLLARSGDGGDRASLASALFSRPAMIFSCNLAAVIGPLARSPITCVETNPS
jgi:hypothetical protein